MKQGTTLISLVTAVSILGLLGMTAEASHHKEGYNLRKCAGLYKGKWITPKTQTISTGDISEVFKSLPIKLRIPPGKGKTVSQTDFSPESGNPSPDNIRLITRWGKPSVRRGGKLVIFKGKTTWKVSDIGKDDYTGKILCKIVKRGGKAVLNQGDIQVYDRPSDAKIFGPIKAKK